MKLDWVKIAKIHLNYWENFYRDDSEYSSGDDMESEGEGDGDDSSGDDSSGGGSNDKKKMIVKVTIQ